MADKTPKLIISPNPHVRHSDTVRDVMLDVAIAMLPMLVAGIYYFGMRALAVTLTCVLAAVAAEALWQRMSGTPCTVGDFSAVVTGGLLAFCLPVAIPLWMAALGSVVAIILAKQVFGGLGNNPFNPAHIGRAFLLASYPVAMTTWASVRTLAQNSKVWWNPFYDYLASNLDGITAATPLGYLKAQLAGAGAVDATALTYAKQNMVHAVTGAIGGCIGETSAVAILLGAGYLLYRKHITWHIPVTMIGTVFFLTFGLTRSFYLTMFHLFAGGLMIGAFFMATDMVSTPITRWGRIIYGIGCGLLVVLIRQYGAYPEGVCYSILIMNAFAPLLDHYTKPAVFGEVTSHA